MVTAVVFGALSCAGRHIVRQLSRDPQVTHIRAVDCSLKQLAFLSDAFKEAFEKAEYLQANYFKPGFSPLPLSPLLERRRLTWE